MTGWQAMAVATALAALFAVFTAALFQQDERIDALRQRVTTLEAQHSPPPHGHSSR